MLFQTERQRRRAQMVEDALRNGSDEDFHGDLPKGVADRINTQVGISLGWADRIRILFGWRIEVGVRTNTEHVVGKCWSRTNLRVTIPDWLLRWRMRGNRGGHIVRSAVSIEEGD